MRTLCSRSQIRSGYDTFVQNRMQDYPDEYLDWIFWVYLSTLELFDWVVVNDAVSSLNTDAQSLRMDDAQRDPQDRVATFERRNTRERCGEFCVWEGSRRRFSNKCQLVSVIKGPWVFKRRRFRTCLEFKL